MPANNINDFDYFKNGEALGQFFNSKVKANDFDYYNRAGEPFLSITIAGIAATPAAPVTQQRKRFFIIE
jgi:hypothetical protein